MVKVTVQLQSSKIRNEADWSSALLKCGRFVLSERGHLLVDNSTHSWILDSVSEREVA